MDEVFDFKARLWIWDGPSPWYFITVPHKKSAEIKRIFGHLHRGWGSIPIEVKIGGSIWKTSIFWEKKGTYLLPVKKDVRNREKITSGNRVDISLKIMAL